MKFRPVLPQFVRFRSRGSQKQSREHVFALIFVFVRQKFLFRSIFKYFWQNFYVFGAEFYALLTKLLRVVDQNFTLFWAIIWEKVSSIFDHFLVLNKLKHAKFTKILPQTAFLSIFWALWLHFKSHHEKYGLKRPEWSNLVEKHPFSNNHFCTF